jgi:serine/threonine-protein kinase
VSQPSEPVPSVPISPGEVIDGKYRVDRVLGVGGMGVVVAATHLQLGQRVALKFMLPEGLRHPRLIERFQREARAAVRLKSDHVARVLDVGTLPTGAPYMVMEFLEGSDLAAILESSGPMSTEMAVDCVLQACDAVAEAHSLGIVHRDLKPRNLFLTHRNDGRSLVKVLDFGISKDRTGADLGLTGTAEIIGSPNYMSPEQLRSSRFADERSDIWALGVILYELLTGRVPFVAESITELTAAILTEPPRPIAQLRSDVPPKLVRAIEQCLEKESKRRFSSVAEVAAALQSFAPPDTRELADRIARIASGKRAAGNPAGASGPGALPGSTTASWSERSGASRTQRRSVALAVAGVAAVIAVAAAGTVTLVRRGPSTRPSEPTSPSREGAGIVAADGSSAATVASTFLAPTPSASTPVAPAMPTASVEPVASVHSAPSAGPRGAPPKGKPEPATSASTNETPKYRTSW